MCILASAGCSTTDRAGLPTLEERDVSPALWPSVRKAYANVSGNPSNPEANGRLAMVLHSGGKYDLGEIFYRRAIESDSSFRWLYYLSQLQTLKGAKQDAIETLNRALKLEGDYVPARIKLGRLLLQTGRAEEARQIHEATLRVASDSAVVEYELGQTLTALDRKQEAVAHLERACSLVPGYGAAQYALAVAYRNLGRMADARSHFKLYEEYKGRLPGQADPLEEQFLAAVQATRRDEDIARTALHRGDLAEAAKKMESVLQQEPDNVATRASLIAVYYKLQNFAGAETAYREAARRDPNFVEAHYHYAMALLAQKRGGEAEDLFRKVIQIQPTHAASLTQLGLLREKAGDDAAAVASYRKALESEPLQRQASFLLGRQLVRRKQYQEGLTYLETTVKADDEQTPWFLRALAGAYTEAGQRETGLKMAKQARAKAEARQNSRLVQLLDADIAAMSRGAVAR